MVLDVPAASDKASLYGQIVDHWQITIADIGPSGIDAGKGGKILLTPPGYSDPIPDGYIELKSPSYRVAFAFRSKFHRLDRAGLRVYPDIEDVLPL